MVFLYRQVESKGSKFYYNSEYAPFTVIKLVVTHMPLSPTSVFTFIIKIQKVLSVCEAQKIEITYISF